MIHEASHFFTTVLILLGASTVLIVLFYRLKIASLLAFLLVGAIFGPTGIGLVEDPGELEAVAELGLTFLLFMLGLEFSLPRLIALRHTVFRLGLAQVLICAAFFFVTLIYYGLDQPAALILGGGLALSSTAIVSRELISLNYLKTRHGEVAIGILLFQDIAAVVLLVAVPVFGHQIEFSWQTMLLPVAEAALLLAAFFLFGRYLLPKILGEISRQKSDQLLVLSALVIVLLAASLTSSVGLSMELGAFLAGMMLGDTRFRHQLEADIRPFRDLLLGLFFISVGFLIDLNFLREWWPSLLIFGVFLVVSKAMMISVIVRILGEKWHTAVPAGMALAQAGEFLFALLTLATREDLVSTEVASSIITISIISMVMTPYLIIYGPRLASHPIFSARSSKQTEHSTVRSEIPENKGHILILGFGRVGQTIARFLKPLNINYLVLDTDLVRIQEASAGDEPIFYGDSTRLDILKAAGTASARMIVITFDNYDHASKIITQVKEINPDVPVLVRTRDDTNLEALVKNGVDEVIPETHEAALTLVSHILLMIEYPDRMVHSVIDKARRDRYKFLKGFYHGERVSFLRNEQSPSEIIHAVRISNDSWAAGKKVSDLSLPYDISIIEIQRQNHCLPVTTDTDFTLEVNDIVILRGLVDQLDPCESYLMRG